MLQHELPATRVDVRGRVCGRGVRGIRVQTRAAAAAAAVTRPTGGWRHVNDQDNFTAPHNVSVRSPGPFQLPPRNSNPVEYFLLLFTVAAMQTVLRSTRE